MIYRVFRGLGMGFQGLEFNRSRSSSSAAPFCDILKRTMLKYKKLESAAVCKQCVRVKYTLRRHDYLFVLQVIKLIKYTGNGVFNKYIS